MKCKFQITDNTAAQYIFGNKTSYLVNDYSLCFNVYSDGRKLINPMVGKKYVVFPYTEAKIHSIVVTTNDVVCDNQIENLNNSETFETSFCTLFGLNWRGYASRIYSFSISRNGVLQLNFIPALDDTGAPCMYDTVSNTAFYNRGASEEEGGKDFLYKLSVPETKQLPYGYYPLSYLESTGTQWIDTGIKLSNESEVKCELELLDLDTTAYFYGAKATWLVDDYSACFQNVNSNRFITCVFGEKYRDFKELNYDKRIAISASSKGFVANSILKTFENVEAFETPFPCALYGIRNTYGISNRIKARIYSFSISRAGTLQLDFQPCLDDKGVPCMYDFVSGKSFYNKDTGANFLYEIPAEIAMLPATMALREEKVEYGILTKNGLRRLYHPAKKLYFLPAQLTAYALENGYKPIIENEKPTDGNWTPVWTEAEDEIILTWEEINEDEYIKNW